jgi:hypothetical protein
MKQVESINEWYQMLQQIEDEQTPKQIEMMAELHDLEVQSESRVQINHTTNNPHGD